MDLSIVSTPTDPPTPHSPKKDHYLQVTLGVRFDAVNTREISFEGDDDEPKKAKRVVGAAPVEGEDAKDDKPVDESDSAAKKPE